jgi:Rod binding domain-containing protein
MPAPALPEIASARTGLSRHSGAADTEFSIGEPGVARAAAGAGRPESFKRFEAMVLQTFIQSMLPNDGAAVYGKGMAGDMWKSLLAEKMAEVMAERGGIGIADRMLGEHYAPTAKADLPAAVSDTSVADGMPSIAPAVLEGMQRSLSELLVENLPSSAGETVQSTTKRG